MPYRIKKREDNMNWYLIRYSSKEVTWSNKPLRDEEVINTSDMPKALKRVLAFNTKKFTVERITAWLEFTRTDWSLSL